MGRLHEHVDRWYAGLVLVAISVALVAIAIPLGG